MCDAHSPRESTLRAAWAQFRELHCCAEGIYDISYGNRFGEDVIAVSCVSNGDRSRFLERLPQAYKGFVVHVASPIWGVGGLLPAYRKMIDEFVQSHPTSRVYGTPEAKTLDSMYAEAERAEEDVWNSWSSSERADWLRDFIRAKRKDDPEFANCGDKFLRE